MIPSLREICTVISTIFYSNAPDAAVHVDYYEAVDFFQQLYINNHVFTHCLETNIIVITDSPENQEFSLKLSFRGLWLLFLYNHMDKVKKENFCLDF
jgi:hypothetical protein